MVPLATTVPKSTYRPTRAVHCATRYTSISNFAPADVRDSPALFQIITVDLEDFAAAGESANIANLARDLVPEDPEAKLEDATIVGGSRLVLTYQRNVRLLYCISILIMMLIVRSERSKTSYTSTRSPQANVLPVLPKTTSALSASAAVASNRGSSLA